jgi:predicted unusual protein kinase regulating ubiquinone biosynthesis (AarF/ABC1/UbiB family)
MIGRVGKITALAFNLALEKMDHWARSPFLSEEERQRSFEAMENTNAETLLSALMQLRGTALKLAQILSMERGLLSENYRQRLQATQHAVTPLSYATVRKVIQRDFNRVPEDLFASFEPVAFAAASLGQVHRARLKSGEEVAVKVLYPGIKDAIQFDFLALRTILQSLKHSDLLLRTMSDLQTRVADETNYQLELANTGWFYQNCRMDGLKVPRPFAEFSRTHVLTTEFLPGTPLTQIHAESREVTELERNRIGQIIYDLTRYSLRRLGGLHTDPHAGNFLWMAETQTVGLLDFGAVKRDFQPDILRLFQMLQRPCDPLEILPLYSRLGADLEDITPDESGKFFTQVVEPYQKQMAQITQSPDYYFDPHGTLARGLRMALLSQAFHPRLAGLSTEFTQLHRTVYGIFSLLSQLGATVRTGG